MELGSMEVFDEGTRDVGVARRTPPTLPDEVIFGDILPRLSSVDLRRLRSTCKRWNEVIGSAFVRSLWIRKQGFGDVCLVKVSAAGGSVAALYDPALRRWYPEGFELWLPTGGTKLCVGGGTGSLLCCKVREVDPSLHTFFIYDPLTGCCRSLPSLVLTSVCHGHELFGAQLAPVPHFPKAYKLVALCRCGRTYAFSSLADCWSENAALLEPCPVRCHAFPRELEGGFHGLGPCIDGAIYTLCGDSAELVAYSVQQEAWARCGSPWGRLGAPRHPPPSQFFLVGCDAALFGVWVRCFLGPRARLCFLMAAEIYRLEHSGLKLVGSTPRHFLQVEYSITFSPRVVAAGTFIYISGRSSWQRTLVFNTVNQTFAWLPTQYAGIHLARSLDCHVFSLTPYAEMEL